MQDTRNSYLARNMRRKICPFCSEGREIAYKNIQVLKDFVTECGKIVPRRISGTCAMHQHELAHEIKRARNIALLSFTHGHVQQPSEE